MWIIPFFLLAFASSGCAGPEIGAEEATILYTGNTAGRLLPYPG
jgi:hypothetical protein